MAARCVLTAIYVAPAAGKVARPGTPPQSGLWSDHPWKLTRLAFVRSVTMSTKVCQSAPHRNIALYSRNLLKQFVHGANIIYSFIWRQRSAEKSTSIKCQRKKCLSSCTWQENHPPAWQSTTGYSDWQSPASERQKSVQRICRCAVSLNLYMEHSLFYILHSVCLVSIVFYRSW